jgi:hypothetical protein
LFETWWSARETFKNRDYLPGLTLGVRGKGIFRLLAVLPAFPAKQPESLRDPDVSMLAIRWVSLNLLGGLETDSFVLKVLECSNLLSEANVENFHTRLHTKAHGTLANGDKPSTNQTKM